MIEIQNLRKDFAHDEIIKELDLTIQAGETLGFWAKPKVGLSTLMRLIAGVLTPTTGQVLIDNRHAVIDRSYIAQVLSYVPEHLSLPPSLRVGDILHFAASLRNIPEPRKAAQIFADQMQLHDCWDVPFGYLPGSIQRLICLAQALIHAPKILLIDEPLQPRDSWQKQRFFQWLREPAADSIRIISSHVLEDLTPLCQKILVLHNGRLVRSYEPRQLRSPEQIQAALHLTMESEDS